MNWIVTTVVLIIIIITLFVLGVKRGGIDTGILYIIIPVFAIVLPLVFTAFGLVEVPKEIDIFNQQKKYIETHSPKTEIENAALTNKKIELNGWLYSAQHQNERWGEWSFYPDEIQEMEPIK